MGQMIKVAGHDAKAFEITALVNGDLDAEGDGLGIKFLRLGDAGLHTYDVTQEVSVGDYLVFLGDPSVDAETFNPKFRKHFPMPRFVVARSKVEVLGVVLSA